MDMYIQDVVSLIALAGDLQGQIWFRGIQNLAVKFILGKMYISKSIREIFSMDCNGCT